MNKIEMKIEEYVKEIKRLKEYTISMENLEEINKVIKEKEKSLKELRKFVMYKRLLEWGVEIMKND